MFVSGNEKLEIHRKTSASVFILCCGVLGGVLLVLAITNIHSGATLSVSFSRDVIVPDILIFLFRIILLLSTIFLVLISFREFQNLLHVTPLLLLTKDHIGMRKLLTFDKVEWQNVRGIYFHSNRVYGKTVYGMRIHYTLDGKKHQNRKFACNSSNLTVTKEKFVSVIKNIAPELILSKI
ncbi:MAG: hypothetical protein L3J04_04665 [Robiginitomaculum sp.]|nr:hypothetical protein [Robiginitomaculum sp.]